MSENIDWKFESGRFDAVAREYDIYRPGYPLELIETVVALTGIAPGSTILEIGSGTGIATMPFAQRGFRILCIEPGKNLLAVAARKLAGLPVAFENVAFEEWGERPAEFDLVMSAQAFHWVPIGIAYAKAARALKDGGHLALYWNMYPAPEGELFRALDSVYRERAPELARTEQYEGLIRRREQEIVESECFGPVSVRRFPWSARYDTDGYLGLLGTYSDHLRLEESKRRQLFNDIAGVVDRYGGQIEKPYLAVLYVAQKRQR